MSEALAKVREALDGGDLFGAYDAASRAIAAGDTSEDLAHQMALTLARMGDTARALDMFRQAGLDRSKDPHKRALGARLLKDRGLEGYRAELVAGYLAYLRIWKETRDPYPGINAATLALLLGKEGKARRLAKRLLALPSISDPEDYYCAATQVEALLILGRPREAAEASRRSVAQPKSSIGGRAGTLRQLSLVADHLGLPAEEREPVLAPLRAPAAFHFCGHIFLADPGAEERIAREIDALLEARHAGYGYGSIAAGADVLVAEAIIRRRAELHIILPCAKADFIEQSVRPAGESWIARAEACIAAARSVTFASHLEYVSDPTLFAYGSAVAMGLARLKAEQLSAEGFQLAIWDGSPGGEVGTAADVRLWRSQGGETVRVDPGAVNRDYPRGGGTGPLPLPRRTASIMFTDFHGFSKLSESAHPVFDREVMGRVADVLNANGPRVLARNTWGDALYAVMEGAIEGAEIAMQLQQVLAQVDRTDLDLPDDQGGMRIALHYGSIYQSIDRVTGLPNFLGNEVARAARIEPVTPPGDVFVTEPFAAMIALHAPDRFNCRYVGRIDLAKKFGTFPMYRLTAADPRPLKRGKSAGKAARGSK